MVQKEFVNGIEKDKFFELVQISIGNLSQFVHPPNNKEWRDIFQLSCKQSLSGILFEGFKKTKTIVDDELQTLFYEWLSLQVQSESGNTLQCKKAKELSRKLRQDGFKNCILKGQGTARYYANPEYRECGDIDVWIDGKRDAFLSYVRKQGHKIHHIDIKHTEIEFFEDMPVEIHFLPSYMYNPITNKRLQSFFRDKKKDQFANYDTEVGFTHTTLDFDLVYSLVHIYRHIFSEGIGLRQLMDYFYILIHSNSDQRVEAIAFLKTLKMVKFAGGIMWILQKYFGMKEKYLLCPVNERHGEYLLSEILVAGNFGKYDDRIKKIDYNKRFVRGVMQLTRNIRFVNYYPSEVLWSPIWKLWHWYWRKRKGYL